MKPFNLQEIRHYLHSHPELSGNETRTHDFLAKKLARLSPDKLYKSLGGNGLAAVFNNDNFDKTVMFRCDIDALPIKEKNDIPYKSNDSAIAHLCGHDGHTTIMLGFAEQVNQVRDQLKNRIVLLFQPAEETAQGAKAVLQDQRFSGIEPDFIFGLHNLPGFERHSVILRENIFASASVGMIFRFTGATSHAAHPENGKNPALAIAQMIQSLYAIPQQFTAFNNANLITIIQVKVGEQAFGTSAGDGMVAATFRSHTNKDLQIMKDRAFKTATNLAATFDLEIEVEEMEEFSATKNHEQAFSIVEKAANKTGLTIVKVPNPFPWSEDFGFFTEKYKGCFFGLGSGKNHPQLHNHNYDFPDELIPTGIKLFSTLLDISE